MRRDSAITLVDVVVTLEVLLIGLLFLSVAFTPFTHSHHRADQTKCQNNLKQIAMAAIQYSDDKRFFPHVAPLKELDGGWKSDTASRVGRALINFNYCDNPEAFICPSSVDQYEPMPQEARADIRAFRWGGKPGKATSDSPLYVPEPTDLSLPRATQLSYGWTRAGLTSNSNANRLLAADKARLIDDGRPERVDGMVGNHRDAQLAVCLDAHTRRITPQSDSLNTTTISDETIGCLGVLGDDPRLGQ